MRHQNPAGEIEQQQNETRAINIIKRPCPCCGAEQNIYEAAGMNTPAAMDGFDDTPVIRDLRCVGCDTPFKQSAITTEKTWHWETR